MGREHYQLRLGGQSREQYFAEKIIVFAPTGQDSIAQAEGLGKRSTRTNQAPTGRDHYQSRPVGAEVATFAQPPGLQPGLSNPTPLGPRQSFTPDTLTSRPVAGRRRGLTLIEVLVQLGIVVLVLALAVPAIVQSREQARRDQCRYNLNQLGLALHNYHTVFKNTFPPGYVIDPDGVYHGWGWQLFLAPYLDASPRYSEVTGHFSGRPRYNEISGVFSGGLQTSPSHLRFRDDIPALRCPSDGNSSAQVAHVAVCTTNVVGGVVTPGTLDVPDHFGRTNYFGMVGYLGGDLGGIYAGASDEPASLDPHLNAGSLGKFGTKFSVAHRYCDQHNFHGMFGQNSHVGIMNVTDGLSNVIMVGERYAPANSNAGAVGHGTWVGVPDCSSAAGLAMALGDASLRVNVGVAGRSQTTGFGSLHYGGANFLMGDGSIRFLSTKVSTETYRQVSRIDDASVICDF